MCQSFNLVLAQQYVESFVSCVRAFTARQVRQRADADAGAGGALARGDGGGARGSAAGAGGVRGVAGTGTQVSSVSCFGPRD
jgi:hypothetical protein